MSLKGNRFIDSSEILPKHTMCLNIWSDFLAHATPGITPGTVWGTLKPCSKTCSNQISNKDRIWFGHFPLQASLGSFRFDDGWILRRLNSNFIHVRMLQICPPSVLPMLQHAKGLTTVVVRTQRLVSYRRRSRPSCKSKAPYFVITATKYFWL